MLLAAAVPLACGAATRPGVAELGADGIWRGRAVELCRAVAQQVGGPGAAIAFHSYDSPAGLRAAADDRVAFVSPAERAAVPALRAGAIVATGRQVLAVRDGSPVSAAGELAGRLICFIVGTRAEDALDSWAAGAGIRIERLAFQEPDEMSDAFAVGRCAAEAVDAAEMPPRGNARALEPPLAATPIMAATPAAAGPIWADAVAAVVAGRARTDGGM